MAKQNIFTVGTFTWNTRKDCVTGNSKKFAMPVNVADADAFAVDFRYTYWKVELNAINNRMVDIDNRLIDLKERLADGKIDNDDYSEKCDELRERREQLSMVASHYADLITKAGARDVPRFVKACVYSVNVNMRKDGNAVVYFGRDGRDAVASVADVADGRKSKADCKKFLVDYVDAEVLGTCNSYVKPRNVRFTDKQIDELTTAYKGVNDAWTTRRIEKVRTTRADLNAQIILKVLANTFKFGETKAAADYYI